MRVLFSRRFCENKSLAKISEFTVAYFIIAIVNRGVFSFFKGTKWSFVNSQQIFFMEKKKKKNMGKYEYFHVGMRPTVAGNSHEALLMTNTTIVFMGKKNCHINP